MNNAIAAWIFGCQLLCAGALSAESVAGVEYSLSSDVRKWKAGPKYTTQDGQTMIFLLEGQPLDEWSTASEIFTIQVANQRLDVPVMLQQREIYGYGPLEYRTMEETPQGMLAEWWTTEGPPSMHGWVRCVHGDKGTVCLQYMTTDPEKAAWARQVWEPILRDAKSKE